MQSQMLETRVLSTLEIILERVQGVRNICGKSLGKLSVGWDGGSKKHRAGSLEGLFGCWALLDRSNACDQARA